MVSRLFLLQNSRNIYSNALNKIYLYSRHHFTSSNCIFMQLHGIVFIHLLGNDIVVNFQGNIFIQRTYIHFIHKNVFIQGNYIHSRKLYLFEELSSFKEYIFIQGNYNLSRRYIHSMKVHSNSL